MADGLNPALLPALRPEPYRYGRYALEAARAIRGAACYEPRQFAIPDGGPCLLAAAQQLEQRLSLLPLTVIWAISASSSAAGGYRCQIKDNGTGTDWFSAPIHNANLSGVGITGPAGIVSPLYILPVPAIVIEPGMLSVLIENLAAAANTVQLVLHAAEPEWLRPGSTLVYRPNEWNKEIESAAELLRRAIRTPAARASSTSALPGLTTNPNAEGELRHAVVNVATAGDHAIVPGVPGSRIEVYELFLWNVAAQALTLRNGAELFSGALTDFPAKSGIFLPFTGEPHFECSSGNSFVLNLSAATQVSGWVKYRMVA